ncbi:MAG: trypsin-like serine protease [Polyangiaceae bacterium]|nr:trypsin-like serine protease [Polyangiaceae bacterium]
MMGLRVRLALCALSLSGCQFELCPRDEPEPDAAAASPIVGGSVDSAHRSTVALLLTKQDGATAICSGTMIATSGSFGYVLTAAHCVTGTVDQVFDAVDWRDCTGAGDASKCNAKYTPVSWKAHPSYDPTTFENDFGLVLVEGASPSTPFTPAVEQSDGLSAGSTLDLSGYGRTYSGENVPNAGTFNYLRNHVVVAAATLTSEWISIDATTGRTACFGDSGGPAYARVGGELRVVGVASNADQSCEIVANYGRVSDVYDSFIAPSLPPPLSTGEGGAPDPGEGGGSSQGVGGASMAPGATGSGGSGASNEGGSDSRSESSGSAGGTLDDGPSADPDADSPMDCVPVEITCSAGVPGNGTSPKSATILALVAMVIAARRSKRRS